MGEADRHAVSLNLQKQVTRQQQRRKQSHMAKLIKLHRKVLNMNKKEGSDTVWSLRVKEELIYYLVRPSIYVC